MPRTHAQITTLVLQMLQDTGASTYDSAETDYWIAESLKEFSDYDSHLVDVVFKIESRTGTATSTSSPNLVDTTKDQFVGTDDDNEKVIHNTTDNTWAIVKTYTDTENLILTTHIMDSGESYAIYNRRCWNKKQVYIGDATDYLWIDSVEYPIGQKRNWKVYGDVLEIDVDHVTDSDLTKTTLPNIDVLVRFAVPHRLTSLVVLVGAVHTTAAIGATSMIVKGFTNNEVAGLGDEFHIADQKTTYAITLGVTMTDQTGVGKIVYFYPPLESAAAADDVITFVKSTLRPQHEELFSHLVTARAMISKANAQLIQSTADLTTGRALINTIQKGGAGPVVAGAYTSYSRAGEALAREQMGMGERKLAEVLVKLDRISTPRTKRRYPTG